MCLVRVYKDYGLVFPRCPRYLVLLQEHVQLLHGDAQVGLVELIGDVPAQWAELLPLLGQSVEEAQAVEQLLKHRLRRPHTHMHI